MMKQIPMSDLRKRKRANNKSIINVSIALFVLLCLTGQTISQAQGRTPDLQPVETPIPVGLKLVLEVSESDLLTRYALSPSDPKFAEALSRAKTAKLSSNDDLITLFYDAFCQTNAKESLSATFGGKQIKPLCSNQEVLSVLRAAYQAVVDSTFNVLSARIANSDFCNPVIKKLESTGRIAIELPNVDDPQRAVKLLLRRGDLQFWQVYLADEFFPTLLSVSDRLDKIIPEFKQEKSLKTESPDDIVSLIPVSSEDIHNGDKGGLWAILQPYDDYVATVAAVRGCDTAQVKAYFAMPEVQPLIPNDVMLMWSLRPISDTLFDLYAVKNTSNGLPPLDVSSIVESEAYRTQHSCVVSMVMNDAGAKTWARMTADNIGGFIAIVLDGYVCSCPRVTGEITGGSSEIYGNFTLSEAKDLANVLNSGKLPVSVMVVEQTITEAVIEDATSLWWLWLALSVLLAAGGVVFLVRRSKSRTV